MKDEFLNFDYIGAPWSEKVQVSPDLVLDMKENQVGNGGFSLRSHKLAQITSKINFNSLKFPIKSEDVVICHYLYKEMTHMYSIAIMYGVISFLLLSGFASLTFKITKK